MMPSMNPSIYASVAVMSTANGSAVARYLTYFCLFSYGSKDFCGESRSSVSQDSFQSRLLPMYIADSLTVVYSDGAGVVPKGNLRQRKSSPLTISVHVNVVVAFACIQG